MDISTTGLCLHVERRFEPGSVLEVAISINAADSAINRLAHVRWIKAVDAHAWLLGCEFVQKMSSDVLDAIFNAHMERTRVTKKD